MWHWMLSSDMFDKFVSATTDYLTSYENFDNKHCVSS